MRRGESAGQPDGIDSISDQSPAFLSPPNNGNSCFYQLVYTGWTRINNFNMVKGSSISGDTC